jgi:purine-binding chemotaxis protein CheW
MAEPTSAAQEQDQYLTFALGDEVFGINILRVREIIQYEDVTRIPQLPASFRGVINMRGGVVPVVDLSVRFFRSERPITSSSCIVIVETSRSVGSTPTMGILADAVNEVTSFGAADIEPPPELGSSIDIRFLHGLGKAGRGFVLLLDIDLVLAPEELAGSASGSTVEEVGVAAPALAGAPA